MKILLLAAFTCTVSLFASCSDDDDRYTPEDVVVNAFKNKYPNAQRVEWENKAGYKVADFYLDSKESEAWFDYDGKWLMTETDLLFNELPQPVQTSFKGSAYGDWRVDDVDKLERENTETIYVIEVEQGKQEVDLYYSGEGSLVKEVIEGSGNPHQPLIIPESVITEIRRMYPNATFLDFEPKGTFIEVDILDGKIRKDVLFNSKYEWISTEWDVRLADVPAVVINAVKGSEYGNYKIDDVEALEKPEGLFYVFELESGNKEVYLTVGSDGTIVN